jgi:signal transduction histidine kinase
MSLKLRMALLLSAMLLAAVGALSGALIWSERRALAEEAARRQRAAAGALAEVCRGAVVGHQDVLLTNYLKTLQGQPEVSEAFCVDAEGRVLGHTDMALFQGVLPVPSGPEDPRPGEGGTVEVVSPVRLGDRPVGAVMIRFSRAEIDARLEESLARARRRILQASGAVGLACFAAAFWATRRALRPVDRLVEGVRTIAGGRLDHKIPLQRDDELGLLSREFNRMAERLAELDRMKADFVNGITHDLKSPLTSVKAAVDVLEAGKAGPADAADNLRLIRDSADRLLNLITDILQVARIESATALHRRPVRLEDVAQRVTRALAPVARRKGLSMELMLEAELPPIQADETLLERALLNLAGNAVKFTEKGGVTVTLAAAGGFQEARVSDTGPGIPPDLAGRLFSKFARGNGHGKTEGTGLGLAIAKGIAEAHGGEISVQSAPGAGTTFTVRLPA